MALFRKRKEEQQHLLQEILRSEEKKHVQKEQKPKTIADLKREITELEGKVKEGVEIKKLEERIKALRKLAASPLESGEALLATNDRLAKLLQNTLVFMIIGGLFCALAVFLLYKRQLVLGAVFFLVGLALLRIKDIQKRFFK